MTLLIRNRNPPPLPFLQCTHHHQSNSQMSFRSEEKTARAASNAFVSSLIRVTYLVQQLLRSWLSTSCRICTNPVGIAPGISILPVTGLKSLHDLRCRSESVASVELTTVVLTRRSATLRDQLHWLSSSAGLSDGSVLRINLGFGASVPEVMLDRFWNRCCCVVKLSWRLRLSLVHVLTWSSLKGSSSADAIRLLYGTVKQLDMRHKAVELQMQAKGWVPLAPQVLEEVC